jgi:hypothetical protein
LEKEDKPLFFFKYGFFLFLLLSVLFLIFCHFLKIFFQDYFTVINCYCRHSSSSSSSSIIFFFRDEELGWMDDKADGWKGREMISMEV